ncbi:MAG TPA: ABC transporter permease [Terracidiphilus sp.]|nr:ABC transporter permease [Terracidiphilus sp.]
MRKEANPNRDTDVVRTAREVFLSLLRDLQFSVRQLRRAKTFAAVAILTLALGIGCTTAIFSVFYSVLLRPLSFRDSDRVVLVSERARQFPILSVSWQNLRDWETQSTSFEEFGAARVLTMALTGTDEPEQVPSEMISGNLLYLLGVNVSLGRGIVPSDDQPSSSAVALLGYGLWQRKYSGSPEILGKSITLDRQSYTVIGILPKGYELLNQTPDIVIAMGPWAAKLPDDRSWHPGIFAIARLKSSVSLTQARAEMTTIARRLYEKYPNDNIALDAVVNPMHEQLVSQARPALLTLLGAVIFVLLIVHRNMDFYDNTIRELHSLPGVRSVAAASTLPVSGQGAVIHFNIQGRPPRNGSEYIMANYRTISSEYFQTLRIPLLQGRWIESTDRENTPAIVVINEAMVKTYFPNENPIGKKMQIGATPDNTVPWMMIVGVVGNVKQSLVADMPTEFYVPYRQANEVLPVRTMSVVLRTEVDPRALIPDLRATVHRVNPNQPVVKIRTMEDNVAQNFSQPRFRTLLLVVFAGIALLIAAVGVYGVMAYATVQRASEIAIRMALGCSVEKIFMLVVTDGLRLTLIGVVIGTAFGLALSRWLKSLLFGVSATDALTLTGSILVVFLAGLAATLIPARRASRIEIATMMREN